MARHREYPDVTTLRLPEQTLSAVAGLLEVGETVSSFLREAILQALQRRVVHQERLRARRRARRRGRG